MAPVILSALVLIFLGLLYFVYDGYLRLLRVICRFARRPGRTAPAEVGRPAISVLITVHNEAHQMVERIENVLTQDYPKELLEVVVASDGSTDELASLLAERFGANVRLIHSDRRLGKSQAQNRALETIDAPIVLFTDADTRFAPGFLRALAAPFADDVVGAVQAHLLFIPADASSPLAAQGRYWRAELEIRQLEAQLDILAVASGSCIAVRRDLLRPLESSFGEDCTIPLDVVLQSKKVAYAPDAIAYEPADKEFDNVIATRARMTVRNWQGTLSRPALLNPFSHPGYAFALWSHKLLRWLSPIWLLGLSISALALPFVSSRRFLLLPATAVVALHLLALVGALAARRSRRIPICAAAYAFILANIGFLRGLIKAARRSTISLYR